MVMKVTVLPGHLFHVLFTTISLMLLPIIRKLKYPFYILYMELVKIVF